MRHILLLSAAVFGITAFTGTEARAIDISDFDAKDRAVIAQETPKYGGAILERTRTVYPAEKPRISNGMSLTDIEPAAGSGAPALNPPVDYRLVGGASFNAAVSRFHSPGAASPPVDGGDTMPR